MDADERLSREISSLLCRAEGLLNPEDGDEEVYLLPENEQELVEMAARVRDSIQRHPVLSRKFGRYVSKEEGMAAADEW